MNRKIFLHAGGNIGSSMPEAAAHLANARRAILIPHALANHDEITELVRPRFADIGVAVTGIQSAADPVAAIGEADAIIVGGGNTFLLAKSLQDLGLIDPIRDAVAAGVPYWGASAGANVAGASIRTTNDMPIVQPQTFDAIGLVPIQINPHFIDAPPPEQRVGETREERLHQFLEQNDVVVVGLREESWLMVDGDAMQLRGTAGAVVFRRGAPEVSLEAGSDVSYLLQETVQFDILA